MFGPLQLLQQSPTFLAPGTDVVEDNFSTDQSRGAGGWFQADSHALYFWGAVFLLLLYQLHLRSPGMRSQRLGTPVLPHECSRLVDH